MATVYSFKNWVKTQLSHNDTNVSDFKNNKKYIFILWRIRFQRPRSNIPFTHFKKEYNLSIKLPPQYLILRGELLYAPISGISQPIDSMYLSVKFKKFFNNFIHSKIKTMSISFFTIVSALLYIIIRVEMNEKVEMPDFVATVMAANTLLSITEIMVRLFTGNTVSQEELMKPITIGLAVILFSAYQSLLKNMDNNSS